MLISCISRNHQEEIVTLIALGACLQSIRNHNYFTTGFPSRSRPIDDTAIVHRSTLNDKRQQPKRPLAPLSFETCCESRCFALTLPGGVEAQEHAVSAKKGDEMVGHEAEIFFVRSRVSDLATKLHVLPSGGNYIRRPPSVLHAPAYILHDVAAKCNVEVEAPKCFVAELSDAIVRWPGFVYVRDCIVEESLVNLAGTNLLEHWMPVSPVENGRYRAKSSDFYGGPRFEEPTVLLAQNSDTNYGHWLIECLPKMDLVNELYDVSKLHFIVGHPVHKMFDIYRDSLAAVGIQQNQLIELGDTAMTFAHLIYPGPITRHPWVTSPRAIKFLRQIAVSQCRNNTKGGQGDKIYLPRNQIGRRCLTNEPEIRDIVESKGFVTVMPEEMKFADQVKSLANATVVVGNLGGAMSNIVFAPNGVSLLATTTEFMADDFFFDIVSQKAGNYVSVLGRAIEPHLGMQSDFWLDPELFSTEFDKIIS